jgi:hypothetical protein
MSQKTGDKLNKRIIRTVNKVIDIEDLVDIIENDYNITIIKIPKEKLASQLDIIKIDNLYPDEWSVNTKIWTREDKGISDYTLELTLINNDKEFMDIELDGLHVL